MRSEQERSERKRVFRDQAARRAELAPPRPEPRWAAARAAREWDFRAEPAQPRTAAEERGQRAAPQAWGRPSAHPRKTRRRAGERFRGDPRSPGLKRQGRVASSSERELLRPMDRRRRAPLQRVPAGPEARKTGRKSKDRLRVHPRSPSSGRQKSGRDQPRGPRRWRGPRVPPSPRARSRRPPRDPPRPWRTLGRARGSRGSRRAGALLRFAPPEIRPAWAAPGCRDRCPTGSPAPNVAPRLRYRSLPCVRGRVVFGRTNAAPKSSAHRRDGNVRGRRNAAAGGRYSSFASMRRFFWRPSSVSLGAMGRSSPKPTASSRFLSMPFDTM